MNESKFISVKLACQDYFGGQISVQVVYRLYHTGKLPGTKIGGKVLLFREGLEDYVKANATKVVISQPVVKVSKGGDK